MDTKWMDATPPSHLHLEGGAVVAHAVGTRVFNFYDHKAGTIERTAVRPDAPTMPVHDRDGGAAWWVTVRHDDDTSALLDQSRLCSIEHAQARGWLEEEEEEGCEGHESLDGAHMGETVFCDGTCRRNRRSDRS